MKKLINLMGRGSLAPKLDLKMRLTLLFLFVSLFRIQANSYSQNTEVSLHLENAVLEEFFNTVETITPYRFLYNLSDIDLTKEISVSAAEEPLYRVLD